MTSVNIDTPARPSNGIQVIARAAQILRALEGETGGLSLADLASRVGLARSTVQRIVKSLINEGLLMPASSNAGVKLGPALVRLGLTADLDIAPLVKPFMLELSKKLNETVDLSTLRGGSAVFIEQVDSSRRLAAISEVGMVFPLHSTANGKALLSASSDEVAKELLSTTLSQDTSNTKTDRTVLFKELNETRASGFAYDLEEHTLGISAVATSFLDGAGIAHALSVPVPTPRFEPNREAIEKELLKVRELIVTRIRGSILKS